MEDLMEIIGIEEELNLTEVLAYNEDKERFVVDSVKKADWCFKKLHDLNNKIEEKEEMADSHIKRLESEIERLKEWKAKECRPFFDSQLLLEDLLKTYYIGLREADPKAKLSTPYGKVTSRKGSDKWEYDDERVMAYLKENELYGLIRTKYEVNKELLKKNVQVINGRAIDGDGQVIDGITVTHQPDSIKIEVV